MTSLIIDKANINPPYPNLVVHEVARMLVKHFDGVNLDEEVRSDFETDNKYNWMCWMDMDLTGRILIHVWWEDRTIKDATRHDRDYYNVSYNEWTNER